LPKQLKAVDSGRTVMTADIARAGHSKNGGHP
jgi:hypothetical protein